MQNFAKTIVDLCYHLTNKVAVNDHAQSLTYQQLGSKIINIAGFLHDHGIQPEQRVLIALDNCVEWPAVFFGCVYMGAIPVVVSPYYHTNDLNKILDLIDPAFIINTVNLSQIWNNQTTVGPVLKHNDSLAFITMTSGSTSHAKAVMHSHSRFYNFINLESNKYYNLLSSSVVLAIPKFYFAWGLCVGVICPLFCGATVNIADVSKMSHLISSLNNATHVFCVPTVVRLIISKMTGAPSSTLQLFLGGEMPSQLLVKKIVKHFGKLPIISIGMTETGGYCGNLVSCPTGDTLGSYWFEGKIKIINDQGQECAVNEPGEIYVSTQNPTLGYWLDSTATQQTYIGSWVRTRDIGIINSQGNLEIKGRAGDCFKINGLMYYASDIEREILNVPEVQDCAVLVILDSTRDHMPSLLAYVCTSKESAEVRKKIVQLVKIINLKENQIKFTDKIPTTVTQKKAKYKLLDNETINEKITFTLNNQLFF
jgi:acyl-coenzyme A synthetase/AMP-(fatty) acid ligase